MSVARALVGFWAFILVAQTATAQQAPGESRARNLLERAASEVIRQALPQESAARRPHRHGASTAGIDASEQWLSELGAGKPLAITPRGKYLVAASASGLGLTLYDARNQKSLRALAESEHPYSLVAISPDARWIAAVRRDSGQQIDLWRLDTGERVASIETTGGAKRLIEFSKSGDELGVVLASGGEFRYSIPTGRLIAPHKVEAFTAPEPSPSAPTASAPSIAAPAPTTRGDNPFHNPKPSIAPTRVPEPLPSVAAETPRPADPIPTAVAEPGSPAPSVPYDYEFPPEPHGGAASPSTEEAYIAESEPPAAVSSEEPVGAEPGDVSVVPSESSETDWAAETQGSSLDDPEFAPAEAAPEEDVSATIESAPAAPESVETESAAALAAHGAEPPQPDLNNVTIHYVTNRNRLSEVERQWLVYFRDFFTSLPAVIIYAALLFAVMVFPWIGKRSWAAVSILFGVAILGGMASVEAYVRSDLRAEGPREHYGSRPATLTYGACDVSVPKPENRQPGEVNRPISVWVFEAPEDRDRHFVLDQFNEYPSKEAFLASVANKLEQAGTDSALLFIHGYNVSFEDAIFRTAQLTVDLKFAGAPIAFCWPSYADPVKYTFDEQNAEVSIPALQETIDDLTRRAGIRRLHIIAHSMGNRVLAGALRGMDLLARARNKETIREIVLAAPDIDSRVFESQVLPHLVDNAQHCTLYASARDRALLMSHYFHNFQRLGETQPKLVVTPGLDTIDASLVDTSLLGHSYIGDVKSIVSDLHLLIIGGKRPPERGGLESLTLGDLMYWSIKPHFDTATTPPLRR